MRALGVVLFLIVVWVAWPRSGPSGSAPSSASAGAASLAAQMRDSEAQAHKMQRLQTVGIKKFSPRRDGFGTVMVATFTFHNDNDFPVKDIKVKCNYFANSGTLVDTSTRTVFETVKAKSSKTVRDFNMGFMHAQTAKSSCSVTDFAE